MLLAFIAIYAIKVNASTVVVATTTETLNVQEQSNAVNLLLTVKTQEQIIADKIRFQAAMHGVDESIALNIACAESGFNPTAQNAKSTAGGIYQFLDSTFASAGKKYWGSLTNRSKYDADDNIELAMLMLSDTGTRDWNASKHIWIQKPYEKGNCK